MKKQNEKFESKRVEFNFTEEMKDQDFNFSVYAYEHACDQTDFDYDCVNDNSLEFYDETRSLTNDDNKKMYWSIQLLKKN